METLGDLPDALRDVATQHLDPGERVVWCGRPTAFSFTAGQLALLAGLCFGLPAAACFFALRPPSRDPVETLKVTLGGGLLIGGVPLLAVAAAALNDAALRWGARRTAYLLTDRRAVVVDGGFSPGAWTFSYLRSSLLGLAPPRHRVQAWRLADLPERFPELQVPKRGPADVLLGEDVTEWYDAKDNLRYSRTPFGFLSVADAASVRDRIAAQRGKAEADGATIASSHNVAAG